MQKMTFAQKNFFREIYLFNFTRFFGLDFFKFSGPLCTGSSIYLNLLFCSTDPEFVEPQNWPVCHPVVTECSELPTNLHATKALTDLPVSVGQKVTMACARKGMFIDYTVL